MEYLLPESKFLVMLLVQETRSEHTGVIRSFWSLEGLGLFLFPVWSSVKNLLSVSCCHFSCVWEG